MVYTYTYKCPFSMVLEGIIFFTLEGIFFFLTRYLRVLVFYRPWRADAREREKRRDI